MANLVTLGEAKEHTGYSHQHLSYLIRNNKVKGRKSGNIWLIDLDDLLAYEQKMKELGTQKHHPFPDNLEV